MLFLCGMRTTRPLRRVRTWIWYGLNGCSWLKSAVISAGGYRVVDAPCGDCRRRARTTGVCLTLFTAKNHNSCPNEPLFVELQYSKAIKASQQWSAGPGPCTPEILDTYYGRSVSRGRQGGGSVLFRLTLAFVLYHYVSSMGNHIGANFCRYAEPLGPFLRGSEQVNRSKISHHQSLGPQQKVPGPLSVPITPSPAAALNNTMSKIGTQISNSAPSIENATKNSSSHFRLGLYNKNPISGRSRCKLSWEYLNV
jgi:hypothetical protein